MDNLTENYANNVSARYNAKRNLYTNNDVLASQEKAELKLLNLRPPKKRTSNRVTEWIETWSWNSGSHFHFPSSWSARNTAYSESWLISYGFSFLHFTSLQSLAVYMVRPAHYSQLPEARVFNWNIILIHSLIEFITWRLLNRSKNLRRVTKMPHLSCCKVYQHVIQMSVSQTNNVPNHGHDRRRPSITLRHLPPFCGTGAGTP